MKPMRIGVIRVITTDDPDMLNAHGRLLERYFPCFETQSRCIPDQPTGVHDDATEALAAPKVVALGRAMAAEADALIVSCCSDPGVEALRAAVTIPVIGAGESVAFLAARYGGAVGVLGITDEAPLIYRKLLPNIVGPHRPPTVHNTLDLLTPAGKQAVIDTAQDIKAAGAEAIAISCTGIGPLCICGEIEANIGIPVIDPLQAEGLMAYYEVLRTRFAKGELNIAVAIGEPAI